MTTRNEEQNDANQVEENTGTLILAPPTVNYKVSKCTLQEAYIFNYVNNPKAGKTSALRAAGYDGDERYIRQEAYRMHGKLRDKIQKATNEISRDLGSLANSQLTNILNMTAQETGINAMLAAIKLGFDYSGTGAQPLSDIPNRPNANQISSRIEHLSRQIEDLTGNSPLQEKM